MVEEKSCTKCGAVKQMEEFYRHKATRDGRQSWCKACLKGYVNGNRTRDPIPRETRRDRNLRVKYGITVKAFDRLLEAQDYRCASCGDRWISGGASFHVDHDHKCCPGKITCGECVSGLLCPGCNKGLGMFKDNPTKLRAAADYVERVRQ